MARTRVAKDAEIVTALSAISRRRGPSALLDSPPLHPFPARLPLALTEYLIGSLTLQGARVLDPMVGSGTVAIASRRLGRYGIGLDRDPLALLIAATATSDFDSHRLARVGRRVLGRARVLCHSGAIKASELRSSLPEEDNGFIRYWFPPKAQQQLFALARAIEAEDPGLETGFAWVVFSRLIVAKTAGASFALDITRSRPHKRLDKPVVMPLEAWERRFANTIKRLPFLDLRTARFPAVIREADARQLPLEDKTVDLVFTSPPYRNAIDYLRTHKFSLVWMGRTLQELRELRGTQIGTERGLWGRDGLPAGIERRLGRTVELDSERAQVRRYLSDLNRVLAEIRRVLRPGGIGLVVLGPTILSTERTDSHLVLARLAADMGLRLVTSTTRQLASSRRSLPPPPLGRGSALAHRMDHEVLIAFRRE